MRLYEFAKEFGKPTKEVVAALRSNGFEVASHMSLLTEEQLAFLKKHFSLGVVQKPIETKKVTLENAQEKNPIATTIQTESNTIKKTQSETPIKSEVSLSVAKQTPPPFIQAPLIIHPMSVAAFADYIKQPVTAVIVTLLKWGIVAAKNQLLTEDVVARLASHYEIPVEKPSEKKESEEKGAISVEKGIFKERAPVVVVMGHVDHGKTTLLDYIRKTRVAAREKGGITQHLGAYEARTDHGTIVFIDTPGHEAFTKMRMRGARVADLAILVVAADDGVMPQTIEAIKHAKTMNVPIVVAINKVDKVDPARIEQVKQQLSRYDILAEEWGGNIVVMPISAKTGKGVHELLEMLMLQAQIMELRADVEGSAKGYVLESKLEKGRGPVATFLAQHGNISVGNYFLCGNTSGRVTSLIDSYGNKLDRAYPSMPVQVAGFSSLPEAGDYFEVVSKDVYTASKGKGDGTRTLPAQTFAKENSINLIIKTDSNSSKEALLGSIHKISKNIEKQFSIISSSVGDINESDVTLAATTNSRIIGLHIKIGQNAQLLAQKQQVVVELYDIIYKLLERLEEIAEGEKEIKYIREKIGEAVVRKIFDIKGIGVIAGCYVKEGRLNKDGIVTIWRNNRKIGEGNIKSLQRDKKSVKEVHTGYECAFLVDGFNDWQIDDRIDCFLSVPESEKK